MKISPQYAGLDYFRLIAALLVVAIHTSPLVTYDPTADLVLTRIIARLGVPFFFMTSAFFLWQNQDGTDKNLRAFVRKTGQLYGIAILLYLPVNFYTGYFGMPDLGPNLVKDLLFDGTLYHLWYFPAAIMGAVLAWLFIQRKGFSGALGLTVCLYLVGLLGDSYFGLVERIPFLPEFYQLIFQCSDYTRNGIFFAPLFFVLGAILAQGKKTFPLSVNLLGFGITLLGLVAEGFWVHDLALPRHDSMYVLLPLCMYFLFASLLHWSGKSKPVLRTVTMVVYLVHPLMIIVVRFGAKLLQVQSLFIDNSLVHYSLVLVLSIMAAIPLVIWKNKKKGQLEQTKPETDRAWMEINLKNLQHNIAALQGVMPKHCECMAVVKADAYGHGAIPVSRCCNQMGIQAFAVATLAEGMQLRKKGVQGHILILGYTDPAKAKQLKRYELTQTIIDFAYAQALNQYGYKLPVHIKIDTGMHRLGTDAEEVEKIATLFHLEHLEVKGIFTHLCVADSQGQEQVAFTEEQIQRFYQLLGALREKGVTIPKIHIQSTYGLLNYPTLTCDYARIGIGLYGTLSTWGDTTKVQPDLRPVLSLKARVALIRAIKAGEWVGYDRAFQAKRHSFIAVITMGYADGWPRQLSWGHGFVLCKGQRVPIIGRICMDQLIVDITDVQQIKVGDVVTLLGQDGQEEITAAEIAWQAQSIANELLSRLGSRLPKRYTYDN